MPTIYPDLAVPKAEHHDLVAAKRGDASARYRVMMRARADPVAHDRVKAELAIGLRERWALMGAEEAAAERAWWDVLANDDLVRVDV